MTNKNKELNLSKKTMEKIFAKAACEVWKERVRENPNLWNEAVDNLKKLKRGLEIENEK